MAPGCGYGCSRLLMYGRWSSKATTPTSSNSRRHSNRATYLSFLLVNECYLIVHENPVFTLSLHGEEGTQALLQSGYSYCLVVRSESQRSALLKNLGDQPGVVIVPHNGGLISNLRVW